MEVPDPHLVYSGAQRSGAVVSDIEVVPVNEGEVAMPGSTMTDRHAMSDNMDFEDEVGRKSIEVAVVHRSPAIGQGKGEAVCSAVTASEYQGLPVKSQQRYGPCRRGEASSRYSCQFGSDASGIMYRRRGRIHNSGRRGIGEQRRLLDDWRAELTDAMRIQQEMFLNAMTQLAARQDEMFAQTQVAIESLKGDILRIVNENRQVQPQSSQVGGGAKVPSTSQTEVRRPADVSQSTHHAVEVRSAQSDRTSVRVSGGADYRCQSRGNALVDAASVVGPRHESVRQYSQYELSGPGMSQMMTGGMPSGVPPSVCPPADAMCQQYVDSHGMKLQVVHTDMMRNSSEVPVPIESVRYFAPNTCMPVNARVFSEPALSYSQSQSEWAHSSDERSEADSGIGCMSRPSQKSAVTGSRNAVKHASFNDERTVCAYNSDVQANRASAGTNSARMGDAEFDRNGRMGQRDQAVSEARPRRSRSKGRASSSAKREVSRGSRSPSSNAAQTGGRDRRAHMSSERPSRGCKKPHGRASSSESSSSDSDNDESPLMRTKHVMKPPKFDGRSSFETFWAQFQNCAHYNQWTRVQQLAFLKNALEKDAANVLWDYGSEVTNSLSQLTRTLKMRFGGKNFAEKNRIELRNRRRSPTEALTDLHTDIRRLSALAYPDTDHKTREVISCDYFIDALADPVLGLKIRERQPKDLDSALHIALQLEVWHKDSERLSQTLPQLIAENKKL